jgi:hypothetical protein
MRALSSIERTHPATTARAIAVPEGELGGAVLVLLALVLAWIA